MKTIATHEAKTHLSRYLKEVNAGETIIISRGRKPLAKLVPFSEPKSAGRPKVGQTMDTPVEIPDEVFAPMGADSLEEWGL
ncbi:MAG: type II toxin-antitoxin system prevent-host-death family antitoxin [Verrucomicrobia bacterium]|jgi:prevent-host-death family protein|nr:type II toxin-antitoxin system prevent-host-death family antitoxin [Verrucomicrobiota bacterium]